MILDFPSNVKLVALVAIHFVGFLLFTYLFLGFTYCLSISLFLIAIARFEGCFSDYLNALLKWKGFIGECVVLNDIKFTLFHFLYFSLNL